MILAGDLGATNIRLALCEEAGALPQHDATYACRDFPSLETAIKLFLDERSVSVRQACIGVPGPVQNGQAKITNLPWTVKESSLAKVLGTDYVVLVNDLVAMTSALPYLGAEQVEVVYAGEPSAEEATCAVLAPGTGCGHGFLTWHQGQAQAHASEGGHVDFAPTNDLEIELLQFLQSEFGRISYERILCGPGLVNLYKFLKHIDFAPEPAELKERLQKGDPASVISTAGQSGEFELCVQALDMFVSIMGTQAGNLVLTLMARGGVYLGGGIPPKISKKLLDGSIIKSYLNKGRLSYLVEQTPLYLILDDRAGLLGASKIAGSL